MGASSYRSSSYSGKGSTNISTSRETRSSRGKSSMREMLELLEEVERCREVVEEKQSDLEKAKSDLARAEQRVSTQINQLDPALKAKFRSMMAEIDAQEQKEDEEER